MRRLFALALVCSATIGSAVAQPPPNYAPIPPSRYEAMPPPRGERFLWQPGHWHWDGIRYVWIGGHYVERRPHFHHWVEGRWDWAPRMGRYVWRPGHWD
jgi:hypothetical protein